MEYIDNLMDKLEVVFAPPWKRIPGNTIVAGDYIDVSVKGQSGKVVINLYCRPDWRLLYERYGQSVLDARGDEQSKTIAVTWVYPSADAVDPQDVSRRVEFFLREFGVAHLVDLDLWDAAALLVGNGPKWWAYTEIPLVEREIKDGVVTAHYRRNDEGEVVGFLHVKRASIDLPDGADNMSLTWSGTPEEIKSVWETLDFA
jgi:hypothetical protein